MTIYRIALLAVLLHLAYAGARVTLSLFALHLGASALTVGALISVLAIVPMVFAVSWGRYVDRVGVRGPMYAGTAAVLIALLAAFTVPRLEMLFVVSALAGSGFMFFHIAVHQAAGLIGKAEHRARNFSMLALGFSTASFLGPVTAGFAIDAIGYRYTFLLLAGPLVATLAILLARPIDVPRYAGLLKPGKKRVGEWKMLIGAMLVSGAALALIPLVTDLRLLVGLAFMLGAGLGGAQPMIMALLYNTAPPGRGGEAVGVRTLLLNFSQAGIPLMFGALGAALGMAPVFWTMAVALIAGAWYARRG